MKNSVFPEYDIYITPDGDELKFNRLSDTFIQTFTGYGMSPIKYVEQQGALQHGTTIYDYKLQRRVIQWTIRQNGCDRWDYWTKRAEFLDYLRPNHHTLNNFGPGKLRKYLPDGETRDIDVFIEFGPIFASPTQYWDEWGFTETLRFVAPDPTFYNPEVKSITSSLAIAPTEIEFPITFPIDFSSSLIDDTNNISYLGTWQAYPTIIITGPISGFQVTNTATGEIIILSHAVDPGDTVTIDLPFGDKSVEDSAGNSLIGSILPESDLATFHVAPDPEASGGTNPIEIIGAGAGTATNIEVQYNDRFIGI